MEHRELIQTFYEAFSQRDHNAMKACYHPEATFRDEVFELEGEEICKMWEMLCRRGKDLFINYEILDSSDDKVKARWEAYYTFSQTGRKVHNSIEAEFSFRDGLIIGHTDSFDFRRWSAQAFGLSGVLFGWTGWLRKKVKTQAVKSLNAFISG